VDSTRSDQVITLRSPFNGETIRIAPESISPAMLEAMTQAGFVRLDQPKTKPTKTTQKETSDGEDARG
jgi:hypothetical protein